MGMCNNFACVGGTLSHNLNLSFFLTGIVLLALILSILISQAFLLAYKVGMHTRITLSSAIYQKILILSQVTIGRLSIGHVINLASNDVHRLDMVYK